MLACQNCRNRSAFRLTIEHTVSLGVDDPSAVSLSLQCAACDSTAVAGDPVAALDDYLSAA